MISQTLLYPAQGIEFKKSVPGWFSITTILFVGIVSILLTASLFVDEGTQDLQLRYGRVLIPYHYIQKAQTCHEKEIVIGKIPILEKNCK